MNRTTEHTPGPWKAHLNVPTAAIEGHIIKADHGAEVPIASLWVGGGNKGKPRQRANARLIAAAPELLKACSDWVSYLESDDEGSEADETRILADMRAAIAKATAQP